MNWEEKVEHLAAQARLAKTPHVDVSHSVMQMLGSGQTQTLSMPERMWMWLAAASSAVAVPAAAVAFIVYAKSAQPLGEIAEAISWAIQ